MTEELKTLKDLEKILREEKSEVPHDRINHSHRSCPYCFQENHARRVLDMAVTDLKQETIKWIKEMEQLESSQKCGFTCYNSICHPKEATPIKYWIKHFFNISEEDLK